MKPYYNNIRDCRERRNQSNSQGFTRYFERRDRNQEEGYNQRHENRNRFRWDDRNHDYHHPRTYNDNRNGYAQCNYRHRSRSSSRPDERWRYTPREHTPGYRSPPRPLMDFGNPNMRSSTNSNSYYRQASNFRRNAPYTRQIDNYPRVKKNHWNNMQNEERRRETRFEKGPSFVPHPRFQPRMQLPNPIPPPLMRQYYPPPGAAYPRQALPQRRGGYYETPKCQFYTRFTRHTEHSGFKPYKKFDRPNLRHVHIQQRTRIPNFPVFIKEEPRESVRGSDDESVTSMHHFSSAMQSNTAGIPALMDMKLFSEPRQGTRSPCSASSPEDDDKDKNEASTLKDTPAVDVKMEMEIVEKKTDPMDQLQVANFVGLLDNVVTLEMKNPVSSREEGKHSAGIPSIPTIPISQKKIQQDNVKKIKKTKLINARKAEKRIKHLQMSVKNIKRENMDSDTDLEGKLVPRPTFSKIATRRKIMSKTASRTHGKMSNDAIASESAPFHSNQADKNAQELSIQGLEVNKDKEKRCKQGKVLHSATPAGKSGTKKNGLKPRNFMRKDVDPAANRVVPIKNRLKEKCNNATKKVGLDLQARSTFEQNIYMRWKYTKRWAAQSFFTKPRTVVKQETSRSAHISDPRYCADKDDSSAVALAQEDAAVGEKVFVFKPPQVVELCDPRLRIKRYWDHANNPPPNSAIPLPVQQIYDYQPKDVKREIEIENQIEVFHNENNEQGMPEHSGKIAATDSSSNLTAAQHMNQQAVELPPIKTLADWQNDPFVLKPTDFKRTPVNITDAELQRFFPAAIMITGKNWVVNLLTIDENYMERRENEILASNDPNGWTLKHESIIYCRERRKRLARMREALALSIQNTQEKPKPAQLCLRVPDV